MDQKSSRFILIPVFVIGLALGALLMAKSNTIPAQYDADKEQFNWKEEVLATKLSVPWDLAEDANGRIYFTERTGKLKVLETNKEIKDIANIPVAIVSESGLTGVALHPDFMNNHYLYLYYTYRNQGELLNKVMRYTLINDVLTEDKTIVENLPGGQIHNGGRLRFGPDSKLYIATGDGAQPELAQSMDSLGGKMLRVNDDGSVPQDNPFPNSVIYSIGHRNPQGLAWHPLTEQLIENEHGETAHDELNYIRPGKNYAWGVVDQSGKNSDPRFIDPILESGNETWAPSGLAFHEGIWALRNTAFMAGLRSQTLFKIEVINGKVQKVDRMLVGKYGRLRAVHITKKGEILLTTSNTDGRNEKPHPDDDRIIKLTPEKK